jgi:hypothetical protein
MNPNASMPVALSFSIRSAAVNRSGISVATTSETAKSEAISMTAKMRIVPYRTSSLNDFTTMKKLLYNGRKVTSRGGTPKEPRDAGRHRVRRKITKSTKSTKVDARNTA